MITGGASGFGREFANIGARLGMKLVLADVEQGALDQAAEELRAAGADVLAVQADVARSEAVDALAAAAVERFGVPSLVFNNAGVGHGGLVWEHLLKELGSGSWGSIGGVIHGVRAFHAVMLAGRRARSLF